MQFILEAVLDVKLHLFRDIVSVSNVSNPRHRHSCHELVGEAGQLRFEKANDMTVALLPVLGKNQAVGVKRLIQIITESG